MNTSLPYVMRDQVSDQISDIMDTRHQPDPTGRRHVLVEAGLFTLFVFAYLLALAFNA